VEEIETTACGLNHFSWLQTIKHKETGEALYPLLREKEAQAHWLASWDELALNRLLFRTFGLWPYPGTNHSGEYVRWSPQLIACANMNFFYDPIAENPWETGNIPTYIYDLKGNPIDTPLFGSEDVKQVYPKSELRDSREAGEIIPSGEEGILIIEGIACGVERELATVNMSNKGAIPGLPNEMVVEVPAVADDNGLHLKQMDQLPTGITAMLQLQGAIHQLVIEAYMEQSRKKLLQAVLIDPTVSNYHNAVAMINEMCELQKEMLPPLQW
jgi:alpha-galactosidase